MRNYQYIERLPRCGKNARVAYTALAAGERWNIRKLGRARSWVAASESGRLRIAPTLTALDVWFDAPAQRERAHVLALATVGAPSHA